MENNNKKEILIDKLENEILKTIRESYSVNPLAGTPFESLFFIDIIDGECESFRKFILQNQVKMNLSLNEIDLIISTATENVNRKLFDNKVDVYEDENFNSNKLEKEKFKISSLFYNFCFSNVVITLFLNDDEKSKEIAKSMSELRNKNESISLFLFKAYLKQKNIQIFSISDLKYRYNDFIFEFKISKQIIDDTNNYFDIISNDIKNVINEDELELAVANDFIVYVENNKPKIIYCTVYDPYINKYAIRKILNNGNSTNIGFILDNNPNTISKKILETIPKNISINQNNNIKLSDQFKNYKFGLMSLIEDKNPVKGSDDNKLISYYLALATKSKAFDFYELVRTKDNGAFFRINTSNGFKTIVETNSEIIYEDKTSSEWLNLIYQTSMKHFFKEEYELFKSGYVKEKSGGCFGMLLIIGSSILILTSLLLK